nr:hypothetical protein [Bacillus alkalicellulosilyticus]
MSQQQNQQMMNQQQQNQQGIMSEPPNVITSKDQLYISDMLSWNLLAMKKCNLFAQQCTDQEIKAAIQTAGQMHQRHYQSLIQHLQSQNQPQQMQ